MSEPERVVFTGEFLDTAAGLKIDRPESLERDFTGRLGTVVTLPGGDRYRLINQLPEMQWLAERLADDE